MLVLWVTTLTVRVKRGLVLVLWRAGLVVWLDVLLVGVARVREGVVLGVWRWGVAAIVLLWGILRLRRAVVVLGWGMSVVLLGRRARVVGLRGVLWLVGRVALLRVLAASLIASALAAIVIVIRHSGG